MEGEWEARNDGAAIFIVEARGILLMRRHFRWTLTGREGASQCRTSRGRGVRTERRAGATCVTGKRAGAFGGQRSHRGESEVRRNGTNWEQWGSQRLRAVRGHQTLTVLGLKGSPWGRGLEQGTSTIWSPGETTVAASPGEKNGPCRRARGRSTKLTALADGQHVENEGKIN